LHCHVFRDPGSVERISDGRPNSPSQRQEIANSTGTVAVLAKMLRNCAPLVDWDVRASTPGKFLDTAGAEDGRVERAAGEVGGQIHTSGHASRAHLEGFARRIAPRHLVLIHSFTWDEHVARFSNVRWFATAGPS
jgi:hypothetical protein